MRYRLFHALMCVLLLASIGCSAGFRAGSDRNGFGAGAAIGKDPLLQTPPPAAR